jgi:aminopeptidase YwaD
MIPLWKRQMFEKKMILVFFITALIIIPGSVLGNSPPNVNDGTPHKPAYINSVDDLVKVHVDPKLSLMHLGLPITTDVNIVQLIQQLNETIILGYLENLTAFGPRLTGTEACDQAAHYLYNTFKDMGLTVAYRNFTDSVVSGSNIEATLSGRSETNIFIICGHYDCVSAGPGADDDGSGVAAVLAAAQLMSHFSFNNTVRFVAFAGEEQGLVGSRHYAEDAYNNNETIVAVLNADMIGFTAIGSDGYKGKIYENPASEWIVNFTQEISQLYTDYINIQLLPQGETSGSDHYYFWQYGYDAVFYHEFNFNDYYHSEDDTIAHMNLTYAARFSRLILATLATMAQQPRPVLEITNITGGLGMSCQITNLGDADALNTNVTIQINGGFLKLINVVTTGFIPTLEPLQIFPMHAKLFGLGQITIVITAEAPNANQVVKQATAFAFGPLVLKVTNIP